MQRSVLIIGSGGREHALARRLGDSSEMARVVVCPGNAGMLEGLEVMAGDPEQVAQQLAPELVVVGPEAPLAEGLVDRLRDQGQLVFGPTAAAAQLETSKAFMKAFCLRHGIRTARHAQVNRIAELPAALASFANPPVVKASGLCAGKGVVVAETFAEAERAAVAMLDGTAFGSAGEVVVLEERLLGEEVSIHAICDGTRSLMLPAVQDHKRIGAGDTGPNTGGMGTYGPAPLVTAELAQTVQTTIIEPVVSGMAAEGHPFIGVLFAGIMVTPDGQPVLLEINVRFGDPETQVLMNLIDGDMYALLRSAARGKITPDVVTINQHKHAMCVVMAAAGYPSNPRRGDFIEGVDLADSLPGVTVYHAGTAWEDGHLVTNGGRVLGVTGVAPTLARARDAAYEGCRRITFAGAQYRPDIGFRALGDHASS